MMRLRKVSKMTKYSEPFKETIVYLSNNGTKAKDLSSDCNAKGRCIINVRVYQLAHTIL